MQNGDTTIDIYVQPNGSGWNLGTSNPPAAGVADIDVPHGTQTATLNFHLLANGSAISFDTTDPIWIKAGSCPNHAGIAPQFTLQSGNSGTSFTVTDDNRGQGNNYSYQLNFVGCPPLDPIIRNGGTGMI